MPKYQLYSWGANSHGQLGLCDQSEQFLLPQQVTQLSKMNEPKLNEIAKIAGGAGHSLILDKNGHVYSCGWSNRGQTGIPGQKTVRKFQKIEYLENETIIDIACGWNSSMALAKNGTVFVWGSNSFGQLGQDPRIIECTSVPIKMSLGENIASLSAGLRHSALVTESGRVLMSGAGNRCQLGLSDSENRTIRSTNAFTEVPGLLNVAKISCGQHHTMAMTKTGELYSWGDNKHGQLGIDPTVCPKVPSPTKLQNVHFCSPVDVYTGWTHTAVLNAEGKVLAWGRNTHGQLGYQELNESTPWRPSYIRDLPKICQLSVGSEHNIALAEDGTILTWGWNEHGNCGNGTERDVLKPIRVPVLQRDSAGTCVGTGAGYSFAVMRKADRAKERDC